MCMDLYFKMGLNRWHTQTECWLPWLLWLSVVLSFLDHSMVVAQQDSNNPLEMYGGSILAMAGKDAIVLVTDQRLGRGLGLLHGAATRPVWGAEVASTTPRASMVNYPPRWLMTATGLPGDVQSLQADMQAILQTKATALPLLSTTAVTPSRVGSTWETIPRMYSTRAALSVLSHLLYEQRSYLVQPLLVGWTHSDEHGKHHRDENDNDNDIDDDDDDDDDMHSLLPWLCTLDSLGATSVTHNYACAGGATSALWGSAAHFWQPEMSTSALIQAALEAFGAAVDRHVLSGYGALIYVLPKNCREGTCDEYRVSYPRND